MYFYRSKSTLDGLKSVFNVFRKKLSLGAPLCVVGENNSRGPRGITKAINLTNSNALSWKLVKVHKWWYIKFNFCYYSLARLSIIMQSHQSPIRSHFHGLTVVYQRVPLKFDPLLTTDRSCHYNLDYHFILLLHRITRQSLVSWKGTGEFGSKCSSLKSNYFSGVT